MHLRTYVCMYVLYVRTYVRTLRYIIVLSHMYAISSNPCTCIYMLTVWLRMYVCTSTFICKLHACMHVCTISIAHTHTRTQTQTDRQTDRQTRHCISTYIHTHLLSILSVFIHHGCPPVAQYVCKALEWRLHLLGVVVGDLPQDQCDKALGHRTSHVRVVGDEVLQTRVGSPAERCKWYTWKTCTDSWGNQLNISCHNYARVRTYVACSSWHSYKFHKHVKSTS